MLTEHGWNTVINYLVEKLGGEVKIEWNELKKQPGIVLIYEDSNIVIITHPNYADTTKESDDNE